MIGIDLHDKFVQLVEIKKSKKQFELSAFNRFNLPEGVIVNGEIKKLSILQNLLIEAFTSANPVGIKPKNVAVILPSKNIFAHIFKLPVKLKHKDLKTLLPSEAETVIPFDIEDVFWDYSILEKEDDTVKRPAQYILFAATPKTIAEQYANLFSGMGITPVLFGIFADSIKQSLLTQLTSNDTDLVIEFGPYSTNYLLTKKGVVKYVLSSSFGSEKLVKTLEQTMKLNSEIAMDNKQHKKLPATSVKQISIFIAKVYKQSAVIIKEKEAIRSIGKIKNIYLTGEYSTLPTTYELAKKQFPNKNIIVGDPKANLTIDEKKFRGKDKSKKVPYSVFFTNAIGVAKVALSFKRKRNINLLPNKLKSKVFHKKVGLVLNAISILMAAIVIAGAAITGYLHQDFSFTRNKLEIEKAGIENMLYGTRYQEIHSSLNTFNEELIILNSIETALFSVPRVIEDVNELVPNNVELTGLTFQDENLTVAISGIATTRAALLELQNNLEEAAFIETIEVPLSNYDKKTDISFAITMSLKFSELPSYGTANK